MKQLAARLSAAREQFSADIARGLGGRAAHARFSESTRRPPAAGRVLCRPLGRPCRWLSAPRAATAVERCVCTPTSISCIVFDGPIGRAEERFVKDVLHPLWDLRLTVGHQIRTLADVREIEHDNAELLWRSSISGSLPVSPRSSKRSTNDSGAPTPPAAIRSSPGLERLTAARYAQFNDTVYQLEPDVKESPGGLRDVAAARVLHLALGRCDRHR